MDCELLEARFARMGARLKVAERTARDRRGGTANLAVDVQRDGKGEFFEIRVRPMADVRLEVVDVQPAERHLLLLAEEGAQKLKFLCGHDERQWFVAAVPERDGAATVRTAREALKPTEVRQAQAHRQIKTEDRQRRKTEAYVRQGEWFFLPAPDVAVEGWLILHNEPLSRGAGSKPHTAEFCYRRGGQTVYVCRRRPSGLDEAAYTRLLETNPGARNWGWQVMRRDPQVYVKGRVSHADHKTIRLPFWHRVLMNTENQSVAMRNVAFLD
jgi:hypothetical protein